MDRTARRKPLAVWSDSAVEPLPPFLGAALLYSVVLFAVVLATRALERSLVRRYGTL